MRIEIVLFDGCDELDVFGPYEVFATAGFDVRLVTLAPQARVAAAHGARLEPHGTLSDAADLVVVPGGGWIDDSAVGARAQVASGELPAALAARHAAGATVAAVCTGALVVAAAGLLTDRPAITHHGALADLRAAGAEVIETARVVDDEDILSAGGVTSGIDLALWIVEREHGPAAAAAVARGLEYEPRGGIWPRDFETQ